MAAVRNVTGKCRYVINKLSALRFASRAEFCMVADVLLGGIVSFYAQTAYLTKAEAGKIEAAFRAAFNKRFGRAVSSAKAQLYTA